MQLFYQSMQGLGVDPPQKIFTTPTGFSNLIFTHHRRLPSAIKNTSFSKASPTHRQHNSSIIPRRKSTNSMIGKPPTYRYSQSMEFIPNLSHNNKVNVINLMSFNCNNSTSKSKTNNLNKITLSNVEKYYQLCVNKVNAILNHEKDNEKREETKREQILQGRLYGATQNISQFLRYKEQQKFEYEKMKKVKSFQLDGAAKVAKIKPNWLQICSQGFKKNRPTSISPVNRSEEKLLETKITLKPRATFTSMEKRSPTNKQAIPSPIVGSLKTPSKHLKIQKNKNSFVLDAWESSQNVVIEDIF